MNNEKNNLNDNKSSTLVEDLPPDDTAEENVKGGHNLKQMGLAIHSMGDSR
ncbi:MAG TPA: hypothetical protein VLD57_10765 [Blastocatellia bacterium]|nr:hypothetical protein [Blastocatellia bacterium]